LYDLVYYHKDHQEGGEKDARGGPICPSQYLIRQAVQNNRLPLNKILSLLILASVCGERSLRGMWLWAVNRWEEVREIMELPPRPPALSKHLPANQSHEETADITSALMKALSGYPSGRSGIQGESSAGRLCWKAGRDSERGGLSERVIRI